MDGTVNWRYVLDSTFTSPNGTPALGIDGSIYACSGSYLYAIKSDGTLKWRTYILGAQAGMIPVVGGDGTIYVATTSGLFAFEGNSSGLALTSWPRFQHDNRNTGRVNTQ